MIDLSAHTFRPELTIDARYNGVRLAHGLILANRQEGGREGADNAFSSRNSYTSTMRSDHAIGYIRACEEAIAFAPPKTRDLISVMEGNDEVEYVVLSVLGNRSGAVKLLLERKGSRRVNAGR